MTQKNENARLIIRIAGKDLDGKKPIYMALTGIKGIGMRYATIIAKTYEKNTKVKFDEKLNSITEAQDKILEDIILNPSKFNIPEWAMNRQKEFETGISKHKVMSELDLTVRTDIKRLQKIKSYKGERHKLG